MVANNFDGAWAGTEYAIVDSATGADAWSETDFTVLEISSDSILISPYPGMLPWAPTGTVVRRRLVDGAVLSRRTYQLPPGSDPNGRGFVTFSPSAVYLSTSTARLYRFETGTGGAKEVADQAQVVAVLGSSVFYAVNDASLSAGDLYVEQRRGHDFSDRSLGHYSGLIAAGGDDENVGAVGWRVAVRSGNVVVASHDGSVDVFDKSGVPIGEARNTCPGNRRHILNVGNRLYVLCDPRAMGDPVTLAAYSLR